ncbi:MAG TPA: hypothetical protein VLV83_01825 [Acidobacteriota bacterium]|nr:hypothetical protein [Acidobacteriota bacterium]
MLNLTLNRFEDLLGEAARNRNADPTPLNQARVDALILAAGMLTHTSSVFNAAFRFDEQTQSESLAERRRAMDEVNGLLSALAAAEQSERLAA